MDPVSVIGIIGSVFGVTDIVARCLRGLVGLQSVYRSADILVTIVIGHLHTVEAVLNMIRDWLGSLEDVSEYAELLANVNMAVGCCAVIAEHLSEKIERLQRGIDSKLTHTAKLLYVLGESEIKEMNGHLATQVQALHILVDAARW